MQLEFQRYPKQLDVQNERYLELLLNLIFSTKRYVEKSLQIAS